MQDLCKYARIDAFMVSESASVVESGTAEQEVLCIVGFDANA